MQHKFIVKESGIEGKGCFATDVIRTGEIICYMQGKLATIPEIREKYRTGELRLDDPLQVEQKSYIILDEPYIYFNHRCTPNAQIIMKGKMIAVHDILPEEEIFFDYAATEWTDDDFEEFVNPNHKDYKRWKMECKCGQPTCRDKVEEFIYLPDQLQSYYLDHRLVQDFILQKATKIYN